MKTEDVGTKFTVATGTLEQDHDLQKKDHDAKIPAHDSNMARSETIDQGGMTYGEDMKTCHTGTGIQTDHITGQYRVIRRNGTVTAFDPDKISIAMTKAFISVEGGPAAASNRIHQTVAGLTEKVLVALTRRMPEGGTVHIEDIQDQVELALMRTGEQKVARAYVIYREEHSRERATAAKKNPAMRTPETVHIVRADGRKMPLDLGRIQTIVAESCAGFDGVDAQCVIEDIRNNLFDGMEEVDVSDTLVMSARTLIEKEPDYTYVAAGLLLDKLRQESLSFIEGAVTQATQQEMREYYPDYFGKYIRRGIELELLDKELGRYDLERLGRVLQVDRDRQFTYLGLQTLYDRYFIHSRGNCFELPQAFLYARRDGTRH